MQRLARHRQLGLDSAAGTGNHKTPAARAEAAQDDAAVEVRTVGMSLEQVAFRVDDDDPYLRGDPASRVADEDHRRDGGLEQDLEASHRPVDSEGPSHRCRPYTVSRAAHLPPTNLSEGPRNPKA